MRILFWLLFLGSIVGAAIYFKPSDQDPNQALTSKPSEALVESPVEEHSGYIGFQLKYALAGILEAVQPALPSPASGKNSGPRHCINVSQYERECKTLEYGYSIVFGKPHLSGSSKRRFDLVLPGVVSGQGALPTGVLAKDYLPVRAFSSNVDLLISMEAAKFDDKCLVWTPKASLQWKKSPSVEIFKDQDIRLDKLFGEQIQQAGERVAEAMHKAMPTCESMQKGIARVWRDYQIPIADKLSVSVTTEMVKFNDTQRVDDTLVLEFALRVTADLSNKSRRTPAEAVYANDFNVPDLQLNLIRERVIRPVIVKLAILKKLTQQPLKIHNLYGVNDIHIHEVESWTSGNRLAFGVQLTVVNSERWEDLSGWAYFTAEPVMKTESRAVTLQDITMMENPGLPKEDWNFIYRTLRETMAKRLAGDVVIPLNKAVATEDRLLRNGLAAHNDGALKLANLETSYAAAIAAPTGIVVPQRYQMTAMLDMSKLEEPVTQAVKVPVSQALEETESPVPETVVEAVQSPEVVAPAKQQQANPAPAPAQRAMTLDERIQQLEQRLQKYKQ